MLAKRVLVLIFLIPVIAGFLSFGGWAYALFISIVLGISSWEYCRLFKRAGYNPSLAVMLVGVTAIVILRQAIGFHLGDLVLMLVVLAAMTWHTVVYERGSNSGAVDFNITLGGVLYLGWVGGYFISIRNLPDGLWWTLTALPAVWLADMGAYLIGSRWGMHKLAPNVSPHKSWEGYIGGIVISVMVTPFFAALWHYKAASVTAMRGLVLALVLSIISLAGDLGESMLKRQFNQKDSSNLLPGHGGMLDRIDTWLWAVAIGYYLITWFWI
ncbi:MAG: CDP-archaeol synthase [Anaerolineae bacterium]|jgi:phosphatidate cytidylyltransferase|nr:CDP-archaeol synthase [Anaerolineae bacterium]